jgi:hypothetical protein
VSTGARRGRNRSNKNRPKPANGPAEFWRAVPEPERPGTITPVDDPTALLRSLGAPPLPGQAVADRYVGAVIERAASLATALAAVAGLLSSDEQN